MTRTRGATQAEPREESPEQVSTAAVQPLLPWRRSLLEGRSFVRLRALCDLATLTAAAALALVAPWREEPPPAGHEVLLALPPLALLLLYLRGQYKRQLRRTLLDDLGVLASAVSIAAMALVALSLMTGISDRLAVAVAPAWGLGLALAACWRTGLIVFQTQERMAGRSQRPALIVGAGLIGAHIARRLEASSEYGLRPVGFLDSDPLPTLAAADHIPPLLGSTEQLSEVVREHHVSHVVLGFTYGSDRHLLPLVRECQRLRLDMFLVPRLFDVHSNHATLEHLGGLPLISLRGVDPRGWEFTVKHLFDRVGAALLTMVLLPLLAALALGVKLSSPGPVFFRQRRVGRDGQIFDMLKFRSMRCEPDGGAFRPQSGSAPGGVEGEDRRTAFGRWLRRTSLDELPQLFNVLKGEMSLIGPRPERPEFVDLFRQDIERYGERHRVKSGITGWAQVHGLRGQTSIADRVEWDNYYIENWSLKLDVRIAVLTVKVLLFGRREE